MFVIYCLRNTCQAVTNIVALAVNRKDTSNFYITIKDEIVCPFNFFNLAR